MDCCKKWKEAGGAKVWKPDADVPYYATKHRIKYCPECSKELKEVSMSYTKGPWRIRELVNGTLAIYGEDEHDIIFPKKSTTIDANARLIASAPELLEMLKESRKAIDSLPIDALGKGFYTESNGEKVPYLIRDELLDNINKAIAKATKP